MYELFLSESFLFHTKRVTLLYRRLDADVHSERSRSNTDVTSGLYLGYAGLVRSESEGPYAVINNGHAVRQKTDIFIRCIILA